MRPELLEVSELIEYLQSIVDTARDPILVLGSDLRVMSANRAFYRNFQVAPEETEDALLYELGAGQWDIPALRTLLEDILPRDSAFDDFEVEHDFPGVGRKNMLLNARKLYRPGNHTEMILLAFEDVTARRKAEQEAQAAYKRLQDAYDREHKIATALQRPLSVEVREDAFDGVSVASVYESSNAEAEIGGDFFDVLSLPHNLLLCAVGDVSGKGLVAAARAMQVKDVLRAFARENPHSPASIMARLNGYVYEAMQQDAAMNLDASEGGIPSAFVCLALAMMNVETGEVVAASAGSEPPFILCANGDEEIVNVSGVPLGVEANTQYGTASRRLNTGDTLILLTDGITEARNRQRQFLDHEGVFGLARQCEARNSAILRTMASCILQGAKQFSGDVLRDDACLLLVRKN